MWRQRPAVGASAAKSSPKPVSMGGPINDLLNFVFDAQGGGVLRRLSFQLRTWLHKVASASRRDRAANRPFESILADEARSLLGDAGFRGQLAAAARTDDRIFLVVSSLINRIFRRYVARIASARSLDLMRVVKEVVALAASNVFVSLPYLLSYLHQSSDRQIVGEIRKRFEFGEKPKLVLVTDTFFEINGVARTIRKMIDEARRRGIDFTVVTCLHEHERAELVAAADVQRYVDSGQLHILPAVVNLDFPEYQGLQLRVPPFLELLKFLQESGFTKMQISIRARSASPACWPPSCCRSRPRRPTTPASPSTSRTTRATSASRRWRGSTCASSTTRSTRSSCRASSSRGCCMRAACAIASC